MTRPHLFIPLVVLFLLPGCLTVAEKEYHFTLNTDYSGTATIRFIDIGSESEDTTDISREDFEHLISFYLEGTQFEEQNPGFRDVEKRLYEDKGRLIGEIRFTFDSLEAVKLFRFDSSSPYMYYVGNDVFAEELAETNGEYNRDVMPVVFWAPGQREFFLRTRVASETPGRRDLLGHFREWETGKGRITPDREN
jgi:hypothetical protein